MGLFHAYIYRYAYSTHIYRYTGEASSLFFWGGRVLTWGRRVPEAADKIAFYRVKVFLFELFRLVWETLIVSSEI